MTIRAHMFGLPHTNTYTAIDLLTDFATLQGCKLQPVVAQAEDFNVVAILQSVVGHTSIFTRLSSSWGFQEYIVRMCPHPLLWFDFYEDDFWHYDLYVDGIVQDSYTSSLVFYLPDEQPDKAALDKKADTLRRCWPTVDQDHIDRYFIPWEQDEYIYVSPVPPAKAYDDDTYTRGDMWQVADFMQKIGLMFPIAPDRTLLGQTFQMVYEEGFATAIVK